jgi:hypothetical protein
MKIPRSLPRGYVDAFVKIVSRIAAGMPDTLKDPVRMYIAGGAATFMYTGVRVSADIDAAFSRRVALPPELEVAYRDQDGALRTLYLDRQYNDAFGLLHQDAHDDSIALQVEGVDPAKFEVRLLSPTDLAVSKIARFADPDQADIAQLARLGLIDAEDVRARALESLPDFVGNVAALETSIDLACKLIANNAPRPGKPRV